MCGKASSQILRISMVLHSLKISYNLLFNHLSQHRLDAFKIDERLEKFCSGILKTNVKYNVINSTTIENAYLMISYFNKNKIAMANYLNLSFDRDLFEVFDQIYDQIELNSTWDLTDEQVKLCCKIMLFNKYSEKSLRICLNELNQRHKNDKINATTIKEAFLILENLGLGYIENDEPDKFSKVKKL